MAQPRYQDPSTSSVQPRDIPLGATVIGSDDARFGQVAGIYHGYMIVERGFFMPIDYYVPVQAVQSISDTQVTLAVPRDVALTQGWERPPFTSDFGSHHPRSSSAGGTGQRPRATRPGRRPSPSAEPEQRGAGEVAGSTAAPAPSAETPRFAPRLARPDDASAVSIPVAETYAVGTNTASYHAMDGASGANSGSPESSRPESSQSESSRPASRRPSSPDDPTSH